MLTAQQLFETGNLDEAIAAVTADVKKHPGDTQKRGFLCELLCFAGTIERVDNQLDLVGTQDPLAMAGVALWRQLVRAEQARQQFHAEGRLPEFLDRPPEYLQLYLQASILQRENKPAEAAELLTQAEAQRPKLKGTCDGKPFEDFRDLDDLTAGFFEVLTSTGKYYWIPLDRVDSVELRQPGRPRDLLWRRAHMVVRDGPDGEVYLPTLYAGTHTETDDKLRLGRATDWRGGDGAPTRGVGLREYLVGDEAKTVLEIGMIEFKG